MKTKKVWITALTIAILTVLVYIPSLQNDFVNWDDGQFVYENPEIQSIDSKFIKWAFTTFHTADWFPLTWISHAIDYAVWGLNPAGHHLSSILFHGLNTFLVVILIMRLTACAAAGAKSEAQNDSLPLIAGAAAGILFGIHPLHVESVTWVSERKDVLYSFFYLLSISSYLQHSSSVRTETGEHPKGAMRSYILGLLFFILALLSKAMAVTLPVILMVLDFYPLRRLNLKNALTSGRKVLVEKIPFFALSIVMVFVTVLANKSAGSMASFHIETLGDRLIMAFHALVFYLYKMIWPADLAPFYPKPGEVPLVSLQYGGAMLLVTGITIFCFLSWKKTKAFAAAWAYYIVILLPVLGIIKSGEQAAADRYFYLSSIGPFTLMGLGAALLLRNTFINNSGLIPARLIVIACMVLASVLLVSSSVRQQKLWKDSITLWNHELSLYPDTAFIGYLNRGKAYDDAGDFSKAMEDYGRAVAINPSYAKAYHNRGVLLAAEGDSGNAIENFDKAIEYNPRYWEAYYNRGKAHESAGDYRKALDDFHRTTELRPRFEKAHYNIGVLYDYVLRDYREALRHYSKAIEINPEYIQAYNNRGVVYAITGDYRTALNDFDMVIHMNDQDATAYYNRGMAYKMLNKNERAIKDLKTAARLGEQRARQYLNSQGTFR